MGLGLVTHLCLTVDTTLSPNLAKNVIDGGRLTITSTICSPPLGDPQEGLSREIMQSSPSAVVVLEAKCGTTGWITVGLPICRASGRTPEEFEGRPNAEIVGASILVEGTELPVGSRSKTISAGPVIMQISSRNCVEYKRNTP